MKIPKCCAAVALTIAFVAQGAPAQNKPSGGPAGPRVLVIDRHAIMTESKLGENIRQ